MKNRGSFFVGLPAEVLLIPIRRRNLQPTRKVEDSVAICEPSHPTHCPIGNTGVRVASLIGAGLDIHMENL